LVPGDGKFCAKAGNAVTPAAAATPLIIKSRRCIFVSCKAQIYYKFNSCSRSILKG
jgi:hypothetical protein